jgi:outer membrane immunogenic protein
MRKLMWIASLAIAAAPPPANAADRSVEPPEVIASSAMDWSGFYAGLNVGYGPGTASGSGPLEPVFGVSDVPFSGIFAGGQIGYDVQLTNGLVWGLEADVNQARESGATASFLPGYSAINSMNWSGAVTTHLGYAFDGFMPYVLGGAAYANNTHGFVFASNDVFPGTHTANATHLGYTVGLGVAAMLTDNISAFTELRYANYGRADYKLTLGPTDYTSTVNLVDTTVRAGLNFRF